MVQLRFMKPFVRFARLLSFLISFLVLFSCQTTVDASIESTVPGPAIDRTPGGSVGSGLPEILDEENVREAYLSGIMAAMTLRQKIAQRFIVFVPRSFSIHDDESVRAFAEFLRTEEPGGLILYPWNYETSADVRAMTSLFQDIARDALDGRRFLICADQEGGRVAAFRFPDIVRLPAAYYVGSHNDLRFVASAAYVNAIELRNLGVNMNLGPVLDVTGTPDSGIIGDRSFGSRPYLVARQSVVYVEAFQDAGVIATAKHFPGHGVTQVDSHGTLPVVSYDLDALRFRDMLPFTAAIDAGVPAVMTAHILFPEIDSDYPVTLSEVFLRDVLRTELEFDGVVISDGLEMGALADNYDLEITLSRSLRYGVDIILLYSRYDLRETVDVVIKLIDDGLLSEGELDAGVRRILRLKYDYGLLPEVQ